MKLQMWNKKLVASILVAGTVTGSFASLGYAQGLSLKLGDQGQQVHQAESMLSKLGYYVEVDQTFDRYTERAVKKFQTKYGIKSTGVINDSTYNRMEKEVQAQDAMIGKPVPEKPKPPVVDKPEPPVVSPPTGSIPQPPTVTPPKPEVPVPPVTGPSVDFELSVEEKQMIDLINRERIQRGLAPMVPNEKLMNVARLKANDMVENRYFSHTSPTYGSPFQMIRNAGITYKSAAENIAGNRSVSAAHAALMQSSGHRANILKQSFNQVGIGIVPGGPYGVNYVQMFIEQ